jgi:transposase
VQALHPRVVDAVWAAVEPLLPCPAADDHPLGCHRPRTSDRTCFEGIVYRLVLGCSWVTAGRLVKVSATTLRRRRDEWIAAGVFDALEREALAGYDRIKGLDLSEVSIDGSLHKAPFGGEGTGPNPTDRGKLGWKWSLATDRDGIPIGWAIDGANRNDIRLFAPTLDAIEGRGLLADIDTLHLDRGYDAAGIRELCATAGITDAVIAKKRQRGHRKRDSDTKNKNNGDKQPLGLGLRWAVERSNSWFSNFGQLRRNTDRRTIHRMAQLALAVTLILTVKLFKWADRWSPATPT